MNWIYLLLLACPIGMGLMMWMMRGNGQQQTHIPSARGDLAGLHQQLRSLEREQAAIVPQLQRLREAEPEPTPESFLARADRPSRHAMQR